MIRLCREAGLREPDFRQDGGQFVQTLWRPETAQVEAQVEAHEAQVELLDIDIKLLRHCQEGPSNAKDLMATAGYASRTGNFKKSLERLLESGLLQLTVPEHPRSRKQKYRLTDKGLKYLSK